MKKLFSLLFLFFALFSTSVNASHLMGGQITAQRIDTFKYAIDLTLYRDTDGIPIATMDVINYYEDSLGTWKFDSTHFRQVDAGAYFINGTEVYHYYDTVVFKHYGKFLVSWQNCCRNYEILNMTNPGGENLYLQTILTVDSIVPNSSPIFLNAPVTLAQKNTIWNYNPLPFDADGDSIAWKLDTPLSYGGTSVVVGYTIPRSNPLQPFTLDTITGQITWMPDTIGHFVASFLVSEFRGGIKIGEIRRDMQIIVVDDSTNNNSLRFATTSWNVNAQGYFEVPVYVNKYNTLTVLATDADNDYCNMTAAGETFMKLGNPSTFTATPGAGAVTATYSWVPSLNDLRTKNYITVFRGDELHGSNHFQYDLTVGLKVMLADGIENTSNQPVRVFPNPSSNQFVLSYTSTNAINASLQIVNSLGQNIVITAVKSQNGTNTIIIDAASWPVGVYHLVFNNGTQLSSQVLVKQ